MEVHWEKSIVPGALPPTLAFFEMNDRAQKSQCTATQQSRTRFVMFLTACMYGCPRLEVLRGNDGQHVKDLPVGSGVVFFFFL